MKCLDKKRIKMKGGETLALNERIMLSLVSTGVRQFKLSEISKLGAWFIRFPQPFKGDKPRKLPKQQMVYILTFYHILNVLAFKLTLSYLIYSHILTHTTGHTV